MAAGDRHSIVCTYRTKAARGSMRPNRNRSQLAVLSVEREMSLLRTTLEVVAAALVVTTAASLAPPPLPVCASCEDYCAGRCALAGPSLLSGAPNPRTLQNLTVYRMTAANVSGLANKNTGDAPGDLVFNMGERGVPMVCRHETGSSRGRLCEGGSTQSWLLKSSLVYVEWTVEVDGAWGPYQPCNLNITTRRDLPGDNRWHCGPPRVLQEDNVSDAALCRSCPRAAAAVGWEDQNHTVSAYSGGSSTPTVACNHTARALCGDPLHVANFSSCKHCLSVARKQLEAVGCSYYKMVPVVCPRPPLPSAACAAAAQTACGALRQPLLRHNCSRCLESNTSRAAIKAACGPEGVVSLDYAHWCPAVAKPDYNANTTFVGWRPNPHLINQKLGGSWFSTPSAGECAGTARPGDGSGCTWRAVQMKKVGRKATQGSQLFPIANMLIVHASPRS
jgi:hypothetical protein